jgi:hypothetical protein
MPLSQKNRIQMAISAFKNKKIKSRLKASETFNVPETTLRRRLNGSKSRANGHKLNQFEEEVLEKKILEADKRGF